MEVSFAPNINQLLQQIRKELGKMKDKAPSVLRAAINAAAVKTKKAMITKVKDNYAVAGGQDSSSTHLPVASNKTFNLIRASQKNLRAILKTESMKNEVGRFKVSSRRVAITNNRPKSYSAKIRKSGSMKLATGGVKWFWTRFKSGHKAMVKRVPGVPMDTNPNKDKLQKILGPSNKDIYDTEEMHSLADNTYQSELQIAIQKQVQKTLQSAKHKKVNYGT